MLNCSPVSYSLGGKQLHVRLVGSEILLQPGGYCKQAEEEARKAAEERQRAQQEAAAKEASEAAAAKASAADGGQSAEASSGRASSLRVAQGAAEVEKQCWDALRAAEARLALDTISPLSLPSSCN